LPGIHLILGFAIGKGGLHIHLHLAQLAFGDRIQRLKLFVRDYLKLLDFDFDRPQAGVGGTVQFDFAVRFLERIGFRRHRFSAHVECELA
jgi:hypothetical protein